MNKNTVMTMTTGTNITMDKTVVIKIWGIVQGVGFRPFVAKLADRLSIRGEVRNLGGLVEITATAAPDKLETFLLALCEEKPLPAEIVHIRTDEIEGRAFAAFTIIDSGEGDDEAAMIPADLAICEDCLRELEDPADPRYRHPFISCMACGPRYTIIDRIPYDRDNTSMIDFSMCTFCEGQYTDRNDRRYHAQTVSCHDCGPMLLLHDSVKNETDRLALAKERILSGGLIALKGVGGYYFVCSPFREEALKRLRRIKQREEKPFAVMFRDLAQIREYCLPSREEETLLSSSARPIVLLAKKPRDVMFSEEVARTSRFIGAFLPGMGLQHLLLSQCGPRVMPSANLSDRPIIKDDQEMFALQDRSDIFEAGGIDGVFYNERKIRQRLDDSVVRVIDKQPQMIRRAKGYAPVPLYINTNLGKEEMVFAVGGQLKAAFTMTKGPFAYVSQYFGDLDDTSAEEVYLDGFRHMKELFRIRPTLVACDMHPLYRTTQIARAYAEENAVPLLPVQHHHAHVASVMAEHDLKGPVLGVSFDGTGYGTDGAIWGGEFLLCEGAGFTRFAHLEYIDMLGGDGSMKEGWKSAMCYAAHCGCAEHFSESPVWPIVRAGLENRINTIKSSSMGRLFDATAAFLGIQQENRYEGECAISLENAAAEALEMGLSAHPLTFGFRKSQEGIEILSSPLFQEMQKAMIEGADIRGLALGFHKAVAAMILAVCKEAAIRQVVLTGGVFQNRILTEETLKLLRDEGFTVSYNVSVGPNDGGISLGQAWIGMKYLKVEKE